MYQKTCPHAEATLSKIYTQQVGICDANAPHTSMTNITHHTHKNITDYHTVWVTLVTTTCIHNPDYHYIYTTIAQCCMHAHTHACTKYNITMPPHLYTITTQHKLACVLISNCTTWSKKQHQQKLPVQVAGNDHHECKWSICTSWWHENTSLAEVSEGHDYLGH